MTAAATSELGAILLAGGRASRVGGAVKPLFDVGGRTLLAAAVDAAVETGAEPITVVAPVLDASLPVQWVREDPPFSGPAAAVVAALDSWEERPPDRVLILACDLPQVGRALSRLNAHGLRPAEDGRCLADAAGRPQWLLGVYRTTAVRRAASMLPGRGQDQSMRALLGGLRVSLVAAPDALTRDVDTWEDLDEARSLSGDGVTGSPEEST